MKKKQKNGNVIKILGQFKGNLEQVPPIYSAIKINGKKLYEYARKNQIIEIAPRKITIYNLNLINIDKKEKEITFEVECSKGTYIRSLCEDIAKKIGTVGYMKELRRLKVGDFTIEQAIKISEFATIEDELKKKIITIQDFFKENETISLNEIELSKFLNGVRIYRNLQNGIYKKFNKNSFFIGIGKVEENKLTRDIC